MQLISARSVLSEPHLRCLMSFALSENIASQIVGLN